jgi:hypothetical protein
MAFVGKIVADFEPYARLSTPPEESGEEVKSLLTAKDQLSNISIGASL